ncbi:acetyl-CoA synthetase-like protein [Dactylonectria macrodidyma]|uniref:Acetyl-CoA synthetase-like protein n=1 Tax=Dactylonectria macrodidyma TaxID=307937 RepID=A0A9P9ER86_9HYPO|nr:acetyl-CoA synthetase-like protein [Dactylonectria macrodidyma]
MLTYRTHLTALQHSAAACALSPALKVPQWSAKGDVFNGWKDVLFSHFLRDVEQSARYWSHELAGKGLKERSIIGLWLKGVSYSDIVHIWGVSRAGFVPQLISLRLASPSVVRELLGDAGAKALIFDPTVATSLGDEILSIPAIDFQLMDSAQFPLPELWVPSEGDEIIMVLHSSGSTSGKPKLVPLTARWLDCNINKAKHLTFRTPNHRGQEIIQAGGSFCHVASTLCLVAFVDRGGCMVLPTKIPFSSDELRDMVKNCGLNILNMFSSFLGDLIQEARQDPALLATLRAFTACSHGGLPLEFDDETWAREQGVTLINLFASTEIGLIMQSIGGQGPEARFLRPFPGTKYNFTPISNSSGTENGLDGQLLELVVLSKSPDCPHHTLRDEETGDFNTGDLFTEVAPGHYLSKGRNDDWMKMKTSLRCDSRSIEDNAMEVCTEDLISTAVVVGSGRPSPALFVEPSTKSNHELFGDYGALRNEIFRRIGPFHERRYAHERIEDPQLIIVVPHSTLPRTGKGNIQRKKVEMDFREELDRIYSTVYP